MSSRFHGLESVREGRLLVPFFVFCLFIVPSAFSQTHSEADTALIQVRSSYESGSYISAELQSRRILEESIPDSFRIQFEKYLAFSLVAQGKNNAAVEHFKNALNIDSALVLDPVLTSPKILEVFDAAKSEFRVERINKTSRMTPDNSQRDGPFPRQSGGPTFRAILFPGWEQSYQGKSVKGHVLLGLGAVTGLSTIAFDFLRRGARTNYLNASTPEAAVSRYKTYNSYNESEYYSASAFIVVYLYSAIDAFFDLPPYVSMDYSPGVSSAVMGLQIPF